MGGQDGGATLQVIVDEGIDRTPKPLMSLRPSVMKGMGLPDEEGTPTSEQSDFFMDRMSSAGFSRGGWGSGTNSGTMTPKSEYDDEYDMNKEKGGSKGGEGGGSVAGEEEATRQEEVVEPEVLTERDLEKQVYISLSETETVFMFSMSCVTVAADSEEAKAVEEANKRYANLLMAKQAADKYNDVEVQTLDLLKKNREVQSSVLHVTTTSCQATPWDIADTYRAMEEGGGDGDDIGGGVPPGLQSIGQLAGSVARGDGYSMAAAGSSSTGGQSRMGNSLASFAGGLQRTESMSTANFGRRSTMQTGMSSTWGGNTSYNTVPGVVPGSSNLPEGVPVEGVVVPVHDPLANLRGLLDTLTTMDAAIMQNIFLPKLLAYRDIQQLAQRAPTPEPVNRLREELTTKSAVPSRPLSRVPSRQHSEISMSETVMSKLHATAGAMSAALAQPANYAPSMAESHWPEELLQDLADLGPDGVPRMEQLWEWQCPLTSEANVSCMAWNKARPDLLAVGYGNHTFSNSADHTAPTKGLVAFWSLKNPGYPLWSFETSSGVTALDFATQSPNILAVGLYDGTIAIFDVKSKQGLPSMQSDVSTGRHSDPVWKVRWLDRGPERDEPLVSISTDGRVTQWSIAKGLEFADLMKLKRVPRKQQPGVPSVQATGSANKAATGSAAAAAALGGASEHDAFISRLTSGMSFDFSTRDERIYIAGTEDGWIHKCSTSYSEQYLESYQGHMGPVYNVQWSPFRKDMFISASSDWTLKLWQEGRENALLTFQSANNEVNDVQWCPTNSTVFSSVTSGGRLEIWDIDLSTVKPVVTHKAGMRLSCVLFSPNSPVVVCGGENGSVSVFRLFNVSKEYDTIDEQLSRLDETIRANVMKQQPGQLA